MAEVVFSSWGRNVVDNRKGGEKKEVSFKLPATYDGERPLSAFIGWDGIILYNKDVDIPAMIAEYMKRVQTKYVCGKCTPGKKGTRVIMDALSGIMEGRGKEEDLDTILDVGSVLSHCKCTLCPSSSVPVIDAVTHFRDAFVNYIRGAKSLSSEFRYIEKYTAPCMDKCPAHIDIPTYIESVKDYRFGDSLATIRESMPLPSVCGRVCPHPCETACRRKNVDEPINIMVLKRSASDYEWQHGHLPPMAPKAKQSKKVAVVGAGPAGLAAAYYLALEGYPVTIYEALPLGGGMVAVGIPPYRQPRHLLQRDIDIIESLGVEIKYNTRVGKDVTLAELRQKFDSVLLAPGAHRSKPMGVEGEDKGYKGFLTGGIDFLRNVYLGLPTGMGKKVFVVGGGNTAIDCVRVALREGAEESVLVYRRSRTEMPADVWEVDGADEEGVRFEFQVLPTKVIANEQNEVTGVELIRMALGEPDASGRRRPEPVPGSEFVIECDTIIPAIGQDADLSFIPADAGIDTTKWSTIVTKYVPLKGHDGKDLKDGMGNMLSRTLITDCDGVFASGDAEIGPLTVVACVGNGHRAAKVIQRYLEGKGVNLTDDERMEDILSYFGVYDKNEDVQWLDSASREHQKEVHGKERASFKNYCEVELGYANSQAVREAERCLRCYRVAMVAV
ncbi:FAD-dependent oxidoreductase [Geomonas propionica]|uniref:FAD-dependent oxidoreductase n=1 Tax=Geomonas propionica TaxID=2798582 RepID=A0ABS0YNP8_9BACT|nr:FAD-dependent oxidoreductase [Geomonas propionica]MBJ6799587.1 FAD-dependent oxidoreductase [Geomonas propionica]